MVERNFQNLEVKKEHSLLNPSTSDFTDDGSKIDATMEDTGNADYMDFAKLFLTDDFIHKWVVGTS